MKQKSAPETYRTFQGKKFILDELSYYGISEKDAKKLKEMWHENGYKVRTEKTEDNKYRVYREYPI